MNFNSYWPVYMNLEEETLQLTKYINFSEDQLKVYSMYIADLIMRIVVEIESISKELYKINNGPEVFDVNDNSRNLYFDTDCINYLDSKWKICNREIIISSTKFNFSNKKYQVIKPLYKANKYGNKGAKWKISYQAIKHDRRNNLKKGNIENLISALGALYILNIYYRNESLENIKIHQKNISFDSRLGSNMFAVTILDATKEGINSDDSDSAIQIDEIIKKDSAIYIIKYIDDDWKEMHKLFNQYNNFLTKDLLEKPEFAKKLSERAIGKNSLELQNIVNNIVREMQNDYVKENPPIALGRKISSAKIEFILNKNQNIYKK